MAISGIKQFIYCKRRYCLMNIDLEWDSNFKIAEGDLLHKRVDDPYFNESRKDIYVSRSVPVFSDKLNIYGIADILEFVKNDDGIKLKGKRSKYLINPIEYKNGKPEENLSDNFQLCAIALCLEEMFSCHIEYGDIFYGKLKRRKKIIFDENLRQDVKAALGEMQRLLDNAEIVPPKPGQNCSLCSLINICQPSICKSRG